MNGKSQLKTLVVRTVLVISMSSLLNACTYISPIESVIDSSEMTPLPSETRSSTHRADGSSTQIMQTPAINLLSETPETQTEALIPTQVTKEEFSLVPKQEGIIDSFSADEKTYQDFMEKKIPLQEDLRVGEDNIVKEIGGYEVERHEGYSDVAHIQLLLLGGFLGKDGLYLMVGTQDLNGNRYVLPVQMTFGLTGGIANVMMIIDGNDVKRIELPAVGLNNLTGQECLNYARQNVGRVVVIQFMLDVKSQQPQPRPEFIEANEKYSILSRMEQNKIFSEKPGELEPTDVKNSPWGQLLVISN